MPEVPSYQIIDAVGYGNRNMRSIRSSFAWNGMVIKKKSGECLGALVDIKQGDGFQHLHTRTGGVRITCFGLCDNELRCNQCKPA